MSSDDFMAIIKEKNGTFTGYHCSASSDYPTLKSYRTKGTKHFEGKTMVEAIKLCQSGKWAGEGDMFGGHLEYGFLFLNLPDEGEPKNSVVVGRKDADNEVCLRCGASRTALRELIAEGGKANLTIVNHILANCLSCAKALGGK